MGSFIELVILANLTPDNCVQIIDAY